ncbi:MAG: phosphotransferase [bacterium]
MQENLPDKQAMAEMLDGYGFGRIQSVAAAPAAWSPGTRGRRDLLVGAGRRKYIVRFEADRAEIDVRREVDLQVFLNKNGFPCPQPLPDKSSRHLTAVGSDLVVAYRHIDGRERRSVELKPIQVENIGRSLAELHVIGKGYKKGIDSRFSYDLVAQSYFGIRDRLPPYFKKFKRAIDEEVEYLGSYLEGKLPKGVIHGEMLDEGILVKGERLVGVLNFAAACRGKLIYDLACPVNAACFLDNAYNLKRFETIIAGYEQLRTLSLAEWDAFPNELRFSALRFAVAFLSDLTLLPDAENRLAAITEGRLGDFDPADSITRKMIGFDQYFARLSILRREREGGMEPLLLAMATGYDYRRYQKVKAISREVRAAK